MEVREAATGDAAEVLAFVRAKAQFDRELGAFTGDLGTDEDLIRRHLFGPRPVAFALLAGGPGPAVGFALYYFRYSSFRGRPSVWLDDLYVHPHARRQGAGRRLMRRLAAIAVEADCTHVAWVASASNAVGMNFYRRLGGRRGPPSRWHRDTPNRASRVGMSTREPCPIRPRGLSGFCLRNGDEKARAAARAVGTSCPEQQPVQPPYQSLHFHHLPRRQ